MNSILIPVMALAISMVVIPVMLRVAPALGLVDRPSARKVHSVPMARVGGWGIVLGAVVPVMVGLSLEDPVVQTYLWGVLVLHAFGTWDDSREVGHYWKFLGQFIAVLPAVTYGGLVVEELPFMELGSLPQEVAVPFTALAMVGVINAINHSDGLDGLAGGEALLTLLAMVLLAVVAGGNRTVVIGLAAIGSTLGFLRYNTHPARLFMGDSGSQFLGFTVAFLAILLTQKANPAIAPASVALILGLPVVDIVTVLAQRIHGGMNWFKATKNHIHHRLLDFGLSHYEAVVIIYSVQALYVLTGVVLRYADDALILAVYMAYNVALFAVLLGLKKRGWQVRADEPTPLGQALAIARTNQWCRRLPLYVLAVALPVFVMGQGLVVSEVPRDFGVMGAVLLVVLATELVLRRSVNSITVRGTVYATLTFLVYLSVHYSPDPFGHWSPPEVAFFVLVALAVALTVRCSRQDTFRTTPMDYLMVFVLLVLGVLPHDLFGEGAATEIVMKGIILLYASELFLHEVSRRWNPVSLGTLVALGVMAYRGLAG